MGRWQEDDGTSLATAASGRRPELVACEVDHALPTWQFSATLSLDLRPVPRELLAVFNHNRRLCRPRPRFAWLLSIAFTYACSTSRS